MITFGRLLREHRISRALTQDQLAGLSTVSVRAIRELERGRAATPRRDTVRLLADGLALGSVRRAEFEAVARAPVDALPGPRSEVRAVTKLLLTNDTRVVTITGQNGPGRTRLAAEVARSLYERGILPVRWGTGAPGHDGLLVLDGGRGPAAIVAELARCRPRLRILVTAPAPLRLPEERVFNTGPR